jgi:phospholipase C
MRPDVVQGQRSPLEAIEHIVVLMLENRSFDHMLGYLSLDDSYPFTVDGLSPGLQNTYHGTTYPVFRLRSTSMRPFETPEHDGANVDLQLSNGGQGFAEDYITTRANAEQRSWAARPDHCVTMGYHDGRQLPVFDHLARHYVVCDRWFSSVRGATMPNRLYSVVGTSGGQRANKKLFGQDFPLYNYPSFVRHLEDSHVSWRWYRPDLLVPPTLQLFDPLFAIEHEDGFALMEDFEAAVASPQLPSVTWIDPGFFDKLGLHENDDHPPMDVRRGQQLVERVTNALMGSPHWDTSLLVVTYDEHGGFFDHVPPPAAPDDHPETSWYGVRVPTLVVSPFVVPGVSSTVFDHTSIIRTILDRFCPGLSPDAMGRRVANATSLAGLLTGPARPAEKVPGGAEGVQGPATPEALAATGAGPDGGPVDDRLATLVRASSGGLDLLRRIDELAASDAGPVGPRVEDLRPAGAEDGGPDGVSSAPRPLDDLQRGLLAAAGEVARAERDRAGRARAADVAAPKR